MHSFGLVYSAFIVSSFIFYIPVLLQIRAVQYLKLIWFVCWQEGERWQEERNLNLKKKETEEY